MQKCPNCKTMLEFNKVSQAYNCRKCRQYYNSDMKKISGSEALNIKIDTLPEVKVDFYDNCISQKPSDCPSCPNCNSKNTTYISPQTKMGFSILLKADDERKTAKYRCLNCNYMWH